MALCFFVSDLHGRLTRYESLFRRIAGETPGAVFLGGDLLPFGGGLFSGGKTGVDFIPDVLVAGFEALRRRLGPRYPPVFLIPGNDDPRSFESEIDDGEARGLWIAVHGRSVPFGDGRVRGYAFVPPTPFRLKDWERYDTGGSVPPGCVSPEEGMRSVPEAAGTVRYATIAKDLDTLMPAGEDLSRDILLFHTPPADTPLDRADLDGRMVDHAPVDPHVGSVAVKRFIERRQPLVTLHGHVHESARLTGAWRHRIGRTHLFSAAHDGPELALVRFDPENLERAERELIS